jgi:hypothetical protein
VEGIFTVGRGYDRAAYEAKIAPSVIGKRNDPKQPTA